MLYTHLANIEEHLLTLKKVGDTSGHTIHKGTPREIFIKEFLIDHLSERVSIGSGEIINKDSKPGDKRNQHDIIIYKSDFPKINFGGGICGYLAESVIATIEVKTELREKDIENSLLSAKNTKGMELTKSSSIILGSHGNWFPLSPLNIIVAYDGPENMETVLGWIEKKSKTHGIVYPNLDANLQERLKVTSPALDAVFILGKGFVHYDNIPISFIHQEIREKEENRHKKWCVVDNDKGALMMLFSILTQTIISSGLSSVNMSKYYSSFQMPSDKIKFLA